MNIPGMASIPVPGLGLLATAKLSITSSREQELKLPMNALELQYNPASLRLSFGNRFKVSKVIGSKSQLAEYQGSDTGTLSLQVIVDSTLPGNNARVDKVVSGLRKLILTPVQSLDLDNPTAISHTSLPYLELKWGGFLWHENSYFRGYVSYIDVVYSQFDSNGIPQRALVDMVFIGSETLSRAVPGESNLANLLAVKVSALANLAQVISQAMMLLETAVMLNSLVAVAWENALDSFDDFSPGDLLNVAPGGELVTDLASVREPWE